MPKFQQVWTPARDAEASRWWSGSVKTPAEIRELVNVIDADRFPPVSSGDAVAERMQNLRVPRCPDVKVLAQRGLQAHRAAQVAAVAARTAQMVELLNRGMTRHQIADALGVKYVTVNWSLRSAGVPPGKPAPRRVLSKPAPPVQQRATLPPPKPQRPAAPAFRAQTVEEFLAAGGRITRCPAVMVVPTQATIPDEDLAALRSYHATRQDTGDWKSQRKAEYRAAGLRQQIASQGAR